MHTQKSHKLGQTKETTGGQLTGRRVSYNCKIFSSTLNISLFRNGRNQGRCEKIRCFQIQACSFFNNKLQAKILSNLLLPSRRQSYTKSHRFTKLVLKQQFHSIQTEPSDKFWHARRKQLSHVNLPTAELIFSHSTLKQT